MSAHLSAQWGIAAAIGAHALVHALHLVDGALMRRELRRRRRYPVPAQQIRKENP